MTAPRPDLDALMERVGLVADRADNFAHSVNLPLPPAMHVEQLAQAMREFCEELRAIYVAGTGENPWEL